MNKYPNCSMADLETTLRTLDELGLFIGLKKNETFLDRYFKNIEDTRDKLMTSILVTSVLLYHHHAINQGEPK